MEMYLVFCMDLGWNPQVHIWRIQDFERQLFVNFAFVVVSNQSNSLSIQGPKVKSLQNLLGFNLIKLGKWLDKLITSVSFKKKLSIKFSNLQTLNLFSEALTSKIN